MNRAHTLAALERRILETFSRRTVAGLHDALPLPLALPYLERVLAHNVAKEAEKDALVIQFGAEALASGVAPGREIVIRLLEESKRIDQKFLHRIGGFPIGIRIRYDKVAPVRAQRIEYLLFAACRILGAWRAGVGLRVALRTVYTQAEFERVLHEMLKLYAVETEAVSRSVRLPFMLAPLRDRLARGLSQIMASVALRLARDVSRTAYRRRPPPRRTNSTTV